MATGPGFPSSTNVWIPNWTASGKLAVQYSRNVKDFDLNRYIQIIESPKQNGYYLKLSAQEAARVVNTNDYVWGWDNPRPMHAEGLEQFQFVNFSTTRYDYGFNIGEDTDRQAEWKIAEQHSQIHAAKAMTARTIRVLTVATTAANWQTSADPDLAANHTNTASSLAGGFLDQGTSTSPYIKKALDKMAVQILQDTLGTVRQKDLHVIINPNQARLWSESAEIHDYIKGSPAAIDEIRTASSPNAKYGMGLPSQVYGYPIIVEPTVKITTRKNYPATSNPTKSFAMPDQTLLMVARPGTLDSGVTGGPAFSALTLFFYRDDMTVERFDDPKNRLTEYHVTECTAESVTSPLAGFLLTSTSSVAS